MDECSANLHSCQENNKCVNELGSYKCTCPDGYTGDGTTCTGNTTTTLTEKRILAYSNKQRGVGYNSSLAIGREGNKTELFSFKRTNCLSGAAPTSLMHLDIRSHV